ncbi:chlorhexidine efflux transporter [Psychrobacter sp. 1U1]
MEASLVVLYLVYTFSYNWAYDKIFPIPYVSYEKIKRYLCKPKLFIE